MAGSRLQNFGTIFDRTTGLLRSGAIKEAPIWYNVYQKYPPLEEPKSDRPKPPQDPVLELVYEEDFERAQLSANKYKSIQNKTVRKHRNLTADLLKEFDNQQTQ